MAKEIDPRLVFERLFGESKTRKGQQSRHERDFLRKSLLDYVQDDTRRLQNKLGKSDQRKLDEYVTAVREIERRIDMAEKGEAARRSLTYSKPEGIPDDYAEHVRLMMDMMVLMPLMEVKVDFMKGSVVFVEVGLIFNKDSVVFMKDEVVLKNGSLGLLVLMNFRVVFRVVLIEA